MEDLETSTCLSDRFVFFGGGDVYNRGAPKMPSVAKGEALKILFPSLVNEKTSKETMVSDIYTSQSFTCFT